MPFKGYFALGLVGVILWLAIGVYRDRQADIARIMKDHSLSDLQFAAYKACENHMSGMRLNSTNKSVPVAICACQAKALTKVMLPGQYSSHKRVVTSMTEGEEETVPFELRETQLRAGYSPASGFKKLYLSLTACVSGYRPEKEG
ncbi:hypothetical protein [Roseibium album]|uniref:hypothetical protein n=1 Tax=Roseibium album TaxID=311410 RepID=UPI0018CB60C3|nr:hypothetical protein [Labrenzia sp. EL_162]MBG6195539.1 hypothetical protein [Labrenzia sp. EL_159]